MLKILSHTNPWISVYNLGILQHREKVEASMQICYKQLVIHQCNWPYQQPQVEKPTKEDISQVSMNQ